MIRRFLFACALVPIVALAAGCDHDSCSPGDLCFVAEAAFHAEFPLTSQERVVLQGINGDVLIDAETATDRITVSGTRSVRSDTQVDAEQRLVGLTVEANSDADRVFIRTRQPEDAEGRSYTVDYVVTLPSDLIVSAQTVNGNLVSSGTRKGTVLAAVNGKIGAWNMTGFASLTTVNGDVLATASLSSGDTFILHAVNGRLDLNIPGGTSALVTAWVTNGVISTNSIQFADLVRTDTSLSGRLGDGDGRIQLTTTNGNISLHEWHDPRPIRPLAPPTSPAAGSRGR